MQMGKKGAASSIAAEPLKGMRAESDIQAIAALCKMAGKPEKAAEFLTKKNAKGQYMSVAEVSEVADRRPRRGKREHMISSHVNPNAGAGGVQELEAQATSFARQNRGQATPGMYVYGTATRVTKERAYSAMLEEHPEAYAAFRAQHNAKALVATLEAAGVRLAAVITQRKEKSNMAYEQTLRTIGAPASADLSASQFCFVAVNASGQLALPSAGGDAEGILQDKPNGVGVYGEVGILGVSKLVVGTGGVTAATCSPPTPTAKRSPPPPATRSSAARWRPAPPESSSRRSSSRRASCNRQQPTAEAVPAVRQRRFKGETKCLNRLWAMFT